MQSMASAESRNENKHDLLRGRNVRWLKAVQKKEDSNMLLYTAC